MSGRFSVRGLVAGVVLALGVGLIAPYGQVAQAADGQKGLWSGVSYEAAWYAPDNLTAESVTGQPGVTRLKVYRAWKNDDEFRQGAASASTYRVIFRESGSGADWKVADFCAPVDGDDPYPVRLCNFPAGYVYEVAVQAGYESFLQDVKWSTPSEPILVDRSGGEVRLSGGAPLVTGVAVGPEEELFVSWFPGVPGSILGGSVTIPGCAEGGVCRPDEYVVWARGDESGDEWELVECDVPGGEDVTPARACSAVPGSGSALISTQAVFVVGGKRVVTAPSTPVKVTLIPGQVSHSVTSEAGPWGALKTPDTYAVWDSFLKLGNGLSTRTVVPSSAEHFLGKAWNESFESLVGVAPASSAAAVLDKDDSSAVRVGWSHGLKFVSGQDVSVRVNNSSWFSLDGEDSLCTLEGTEHRNRYLAFGDEVKKWIYGLLPASIVVVRTLLTLSFQHHGIKFEGQSPATFVSFLNNRANTLDSRGLADYMYQSSGAWDALRNYQDFRTHLNRTLGPDANATSYFQDLVALQALADYLNEYRATNRTLSAAGFTADDVTRLRNGDPEMLARLVTLVEPMSRAIPMPAASSQVMPGQGILGLPEVAIPRHEVPLLPNHFPTPYLHTLGENIGEDPVFGFLEGQLNAGRGDSSFDDDGVGEDSEIQQDNSDADAGQSDPNAGAGAGQDAVNGDANVMQMPARWQLSGADGNYRMISGPGEGRFAQGPQLVATNSPLQVTENPEGVPGYSLEWDEIDPVNGFRPLQYRIYVRAQNPSNPENGIAFRSSYLVGGFSSGIAESYRLFIPLRDLLVALERFAADHRVPVHSLRLSFRLTAVIYDAPGMDMAEVSASSAARFRSLMNQGELRFGAIQFPPVLANVLNGRGDRSLSRNYGLVGEPASQNVGVRSPFIFRSEPRAFISHTLRMPAGGNEEPIVRSYPVPVPVLGYSRLTGTTDFRRADIVNTLRGVVDPHGWYHIYVVFPNGDVSYTSVLGSSILGFPIDRREDGVAVAATGEFLDVIGVGGDALRTFFNWFTRDEQRFIDNPGNAVTQGIVVTSRSNDYINFGVSVINSVSDEAVFRMQAWNGELLRWEDVHESAIAGRVLNGRLIVNIRRSLLNQNASADATRTVYLRGFIVDERQSSLILEAEPIRGNNELTVRLDDVPDADQESVELDGHTHDDDPQPRVLRASVSDTVADDTWTQDKVANVLLAGMRSVLEHDAAVAADELYRASGVSPLTWRADALSARGALPRLGKLACGGLPQNSIVDVRVPSGNLADKSRKSVVTFRYIGPGIPISVATGLSPMNVSQVKVSRVAASVVGGADLGVLSVPVDDSVGDVRGWWRPKGSPGAWKPCIDPRTAIKRLASGSIWCPGIDHAGTVEFVLQESRMKDGVLGWSPISSTVFASGSLPELEPKTVRINKTLLVPMAYFDDTLDKDLSVNAIHIQWSGGVGPYRVLLKDRRGVQEACDLYDVYEVGGAPNKVTSGNRGFCVFPKNGLVYQLQVEDLGASSVSSIGVSSLSKSTGEVCSGATFAKCSGDRHLQATGGAGTSVDDTSISLVPLSAPTGMNAVVEGQNISVSFTPSSNAGEELIDGHKVVCETDSGSKLSAETASDSATLAAKAGIWSCSVSAFREQTGQKSSVVTGSSVEVFEPPVAPIGLKLEGSAPGEMKFSWKVEEGQASLISGFTVQYQFKDSAPVLLDVSGTDRSVSLKGLQGGREVKVQVKAYGRGGDSQWSAAVTGTVPATAPEAPLAVTGSGVNGVATISWVPGYDGGKPVTSADVVCSYVASDSGWFPWVPSGRRVSSPAVRVNEALEIKEGRVSVKVKGLNVDRSGYTCSVSLLNSVGSSAGAVVNISLFSPPPAPSGVKVSRVRVFGVSTPWVNLSWGAVAGVDDYKIYWSRNGSPWREEPSLKGNWTFVLMAFGKGYDLAVASVYKGRESERSMVVRTS